MCRCSVYIDIRGRCLPCREPDEFRICPARVDTALWLMENDYEFCRNIDSKITKKDKHNVLKREAKKTYKFNDRDIEKLIQLYDDNND